MGGERVERRLAAILAADVAGYSRLMGVDEEGTLAALKALRREVIDPGIAEHRGRIVKTTGDGMLVEFQSVIDAVRCASHVQTVMVERNAEIPVERRVEFRVGINLGDIMIDEGDIYGDGVNVAARLEGLADPGGICVSRVVYDQVRDRLDLAFEDMGEQQVKNIARPVRVYRIIRLASSRAEAIAQQTPNLPDKPSIAVLPFQNMSGDPEQEYFADGMVEEIITALARIHWLFVIARNSTFIYKGQAVDVKRVGRELGVRYVLEGSVRKGGNRVRITAQLIEAENGAHLWADRFDGSIEDVFEFQDEVASRVAGVIEPTLHSVEARRSVERPTNDLTAYDLYLRAYSLGFVWAKEPTLQALGLLEKAIERDPQYGPALGLAAVCRFQIDLNGWTDDLEANRREGVSLARRAVGAVSDDPSTLAPAALALAYFDEPIATTMILIDRALSMNPSFALGWFFSGMVRNWAGQPDVAIEHLENSLRLSPRIRMGTLSYQIGLAHFLSHRFEEAVVKILDAIQDRPNNPQAYRALASCYAHLGRMNQARQTIERLRLINPIVVPPLNHFRDPEHRELFLSGLRLATGEATQ